MTGGIGTSFVRQTLRRGASKVYATARARRMDRRPTLEINDAASIAGVHLVSEHASGPKMQAADQVATVLDAVEANQFEVVDDETSAHVKAELTGPIAALYPEPKGGR